MSSLDDERLNPKFSTIDSFDDAGDDLHMYDKPTTRQVQIATVQLAGAIAVLALAAIGAIELIDPIQNAAYKIGEVAVYGPCTVVGLAILKTDIIGKVSQFIKARLAKVLIYAKVVEWQVDVIVGAFTLVEDIVRAAFIYTLIYVFTEAVIPDDSEYYIPRCLQFLAKRREFTGTQVEQIIHDVTGRLLNAYLCLEIYRFFLRIKTPKPSIHLNYDDGFLSRYLMTLTGRLDGTKGTIQYAGVYFLVDRIINLALMVVFTSQILSIFGLSLKAIAAVASVGALAVSFAARPLVENLISGFIIFLNNPFTVGEHIIAGHVHGYVSKIDWLVTTVKTAQGSELVPNHDLANKALINESRLGRNVAAVQNLHLCPIIPGEDRLKEALESMDSTLHKHPLVEGHTAVWMNGTNATSGLFTFSVEFAIKDRPDDREETLKLRSKVLSDVYAAAQKCGYAVRGTVQDTK